mmetsp:Transcript_12035/g.17384  ORF Transcript_12035/g.17384 Transcript_12035/m.17384 type:complete len:161 (+) Transcript_12035:109-591(+)
MSKRRASDDGEGAMQKGLLPSREEAVAAASVAVRALALKSQQEALSMLQQAPDLNPLLKYALSADPAAGQGPAAQPFLVVFHVLKMLLGMRWQAVKSSADLIGQLQQWQTSWVSSPAEVEKIERFVEQHETEFCEGDHLGGSSENALFMWTDATVTLVSV